MFPHDLLPQPVPSRELSLRSYDHGVRALPTSHGVVCPSSLPALLLCALVLGCSPDPPSELCFARLFPSNGTRLVDPLARVVVILGPGWDSWGDSRTFGLLLSGGDGDGDGDIDGTLGSEVDQSSGSLVLTFSPEESLPPGEWVDTVLTVGGERRVISRWRVSTAGLPVPNPDFVAGSTVVLQFEWESPFTSAAMAGRWQVNAMIQLTPNASGYSVGGADFAAPFPLTYSQDPCSPTSSVGRLDGGYLSMGSVEFVNPVVRLQNATLPSAIWRWGEGSKPGLLSVRNLELTFLPDSNDGVVVSEFEAEFLADPLGRELLSADEFLCPGDPCVACAGASSQRCVSASGASGVQATIVRNPTDLQPIVCGEQDALCFDAASGVCSWLDPKWE